MPFFRSETLYSYQFENADRVLEPSQPGLNPRLEALVYSDYPMEAAASTCLAIIFGRIASCIPWFLRTTVVLMQLLYQCNH